MSPLSGYLWRVICAALVCAFVRAIGGDGAGSGLRKSMAGLFLTLTVLSPLGDPELPMLDTGSIESEARAAVMAGTRQAEREKNAIITESLEAYIWNKASQLGLELEVRVTLDDDGMPKSLVLTGAASPMDRKTLGDAIARDLGLGKEALVWILPHQSCE